MKFVRERVAPVILAVCLWLVGNGLIDSAPASGADPEVQQHPVCTGYTQTDFNINCNLDLQSKTCSGWQQASHPESSCQGQGGDPQHPCISGTQNTIIYIDYGTCHFSASPVWHCEKDGQFTDVETLPKSNVPHCSTSNPPPGYVRNLSPISKNARQIASRQ